MLDSATVVDDNKELADWGKGLVFLKEEAEHSGTGLDAVFADGYAGWGERFRLVVPCAQYLAPAIGH